MQVLEKLKSVLEVVSTQREYEVKANCPFCVHTGRSPDRKHHLGISLRPGFLVCHCFRCGYSGSVPKLLHDVAGMTYRDAHELTGAVVMAKPKPPEPFRAIELPEGCLPLDRRNTEHRRAYRYLEGRGVDDRLISAFDIRFCVSGLFGQRVVFPVYFKDGLIGFTARAIDAEVVPKYRFPLGFSAANCLYNYDRAKDAECAVLVEGPMDAWRLPERAVALFGQHLSDAQRLLIARTWKRVVVLLDSDAATASYQIYKLLVPYVEVSVATLPRSKDPWDAPYDEVLEALAFPKSGGLGVFLEDRSRI